MSEGNGVKKDPVTGQFLKGHKGGPGAPKGTRKVDMLALCRRKADEDLLDGKNNGLDLDGMIWAMMKGLMVQAGKGNARCAQIVLDYLAVAPDRRPVVNVDVDARQVNVGTGPPVPEGAALGAYIREIEDIASNLITVEVLPEPDDATMAEIEELLS